MDFEYVACFQENQENFTGYLVQYLEFEGSFVPLMTREAQELVCERASYDNYTHPDEIPFNRTALLTTTHGVAGKIPLTEDSVPEISLTTIGGSKLGDKMVLKGVTSFGTPGVILVNCTLRMENKTFQIIDNNLAQPREPLSAVAASLLQPMVAAEPVLRQENFTTEGTFMTATTENQCFIGAGLIQRGTWALASN
ncbi:Oidioi.mRNA.OKI2018_I69.chr2.g8266.t1.cds [Oikopleura dioica]|uniref:Oidioi.mRNA.OKI2018_I69.chr2.g8266.t1.cds n=1 Tax=Oikopleura dioica TaxID=34765 RepID=A0ABN7TF58_OIKDI|nr:Oidioi.mRNA.OKI2018_I69.chr2.g8266.t1.cds [Oikopleura dioica]